MRDVKDFTLRHLGETVKSPDNLDGANMMMRAYHIAEHGAKAELAQIAIPEPGPREIRVKIAACGLNFADLLMQKGTYQDTPEPPFTLGMEVADRVDWPSSAASRPRAPLPFPKR